MLLLFESIAVASFIFATASALACFQLRNEFHHIGFGLGLDFGRRAITIDMSDKYVELNLNVIDDDCVICCEKLNCGQLVQCCKCKTIVHKECLVEHLIYLENNKMNFKCVIGCE